MFLRIYRLMNCTRRIRPHPRRLLLARRFFCLIYIRWKLSSSAAAFLFIKAWWIGANWGQPAYFLLHFGSCSFCFWFPSCALYGWLGILSRTKNQNKIEIIDPNSSVCSKLNQTETRWNHSIGLGAEKANSSDLDTSARYIEFWLTPICFAAVEAAHSDIISLNCMTNRAYQLLNGYVFHQQQLRVSRFFLAFFCRCSLTKIFCCNTFIVVLNAVHVEGRCLSASMFVAVLLYFAWNANQFRLFNSEIGSVVVLANIFISATYRIYSRRFSLTTWLSTLR